MHELVRAPALQYPSTNFRHSSREYVARMMTLQGLPDDIFALILEHLVASVGIFKAVRLRLVNSKLKCSSEVKNCPFHSSTFDAIIIFRTL
jgi:hypothetical protein